MRSPPFQMTVCEEGPQRQVSARFHVCDVVVVVVINFGFTGKSQRQYRVPVSPYTQVSLMLTSLTTAVHLSKLRN